MITQACRNNEAKAAKIFVEAVRWQARVVESLEKINEL